LSEKYGTQGIPGSIIWTQTNPTRGMMDITVAKIGKGIIITFGLSGVQGIPIANVRASYVIELPGKWFISFGAQISPTDAELM
jgi:hypothetical protein